MKDNNNYSSCNRLVLARREMIIQFNSLVLYPFPFGEHYVHGCISLVSRGNKSFVVLVQVLVSGFKHLSVHGCISLVSRGIYPGRELSL